MKKLIYCLLALSILFIVSCRKDFEINHKNLNFSISQDSIFISNVYTGTKSPVYSFSIKNKTNNDILIPSIALRKNQSKIVLNIYGKSGQSFNDVPLLKHDSIRILLHLSAEEDTHTQYYEDAIIFSDNKNKEKSVAVLSFLEKSKIYYSSSDLKFINKKANLDNSETHIFYKDLEVPENSILTIQAGTQLRFFNQSSIQLKPNSTLKTEGTPEKRVVFKGFRNEPRYDSLPGQWKGITANESEVILNATLIQGAQSAITAKKSKLDINQSLIVNASVYGINTNESSLQLINSVIFNAGETGLFVRNPLKSNIIFSTIANPWIANVTGISGQKLPFELSENSHQSFNVVNSIFYGRSANGIKIPQSDLSNLKFDHNLIKNNNPEGLNLSLPIFSNIIVAEPLFNSTLFSKPNLSLKEDSPAKNKGYYLEAYKKDINNENRNNPPNLGAYR